VVVADDVDTFKLIKMHGSRSWLYSGRESFYGEVIYDLGGTRGWKPHVSSRREMALAVDKVPLVIPPTTGKTGFFNNETVRSQWSQALEELRLADTIYVIGYSFPPSDAMTRYLLQESHHRGRKIIIVSRSDRAVAQVKNFVPTESLATPITGENSVMHLAERLTPTTVTPEADVM
jgi:hypothetical protein